ncbi:MAG: antitoxin [Pseudolysinimonas sp.]
MRTTLELDDTVLAVARSLSRDEGISLGAAVSRLAQKGMRSGSVTATGAFPVFTVPVDAPPITVDMVNDHRDDN